MPIEKSTNPQQGTSRVFLRLPQVQSKIPYSRSTIYLKMSLGEFPKAVSLGGNAVAWIEAEIDQWISERIAASR